MNQGKRALIITFLAGLFLLSIFVYKNSKEYIQKITYLPPSPTVFIEKLTENNKEKSKKPTAEKTTEKNQKETLPEKTKKKESKEELKRNSSNKIDFNSLEKKLKDAKKLLNSIKNNVKEDKVTQEAEKTQKDFHSINKDVRESLVNIICSSEANGIFKPMSGSGVMISPKGVILTNAHIGQYFLLKDYPREDYTNCVIRTGAPAKNRYKANLLYISTRWITQNSDIITSNEPTGTGKNDYALLLINKSTSKADLPETFKYTSPIVSNSHIEEGDKMLLASYPSGFLSGITIQKELYPSSAIDKIEAFYTFETKTLDLMKFRGNIIAQKGSSGGAVVDENNLLSGLIVTSSMEPQTGERAMHAITLSHINRSLSKETGFGIEKLLGSNLSKTLENFKKNAFPKLKDILVKAIEK